jgi:hypothetical protein
MQAVSLNDIVYEHINQDYGWGKYGIFKVLIQKRMDMLISQSCAKKVEEDFLTGVPKMHQNN